MKYKLNNKKLSIFHFLKFLFSVKYYLLLILIISIFFSSIYWNFYYNKKLTTSFSLNYPSFASLYVLEKNLFDKDYKDIEEFSLIFAKTLQRKIRREILSKKNFNEFLKKKNISENLVNLTYSKDTVYLKHPLLLDGMSFSQEYMIIVKNKVMDYLYKEINLIINYNKNNVELTESLSSLFNSQKLENNYNLLSINLFGQTVTLDLPSVILLNKKKSDQILADYNNLKENFKVIDLFTNINKKTYYNLFEFVSIISLISLFISILLLILFNFLFKGNLKI